MITEWLVAVGVGIAQWFLSLFPEWEVPAEVVAFDVMLNGFIDDFGALTAWVPWALLIFCIGVSLTVYVAGFGVRFIAWLWSKVPFVGGGG